MADDSPSLTEVFAAALDKQPRAWPRSGWQRESSGPDAADFVNGGFRIHLRQVGGRWQLVSTGDDFAKTRRYWWLWLAAGLVVTTAGLMELVAAGNPTWAGAFVIGLALLARSLFDRAHAWRRRGGHVPVASLYDDQ